MTIQTFVFLFEIPGIFIVTLVVRKKDVQGIPTLKKMQGSCLAQLEFEKSSEFNGKFADVFTKTEHSQIPLVDKSIPFMEDIVVSKEGKCYKMTFKLLKNPLKLPLISFVKANCLAIELEERQ